MNKINKNFLVVSNYKNDTSWIPEYTENYIVYNKTDSPISKNVNPTKVIESPNIGYNFYDYFTYIIDNYENLPECIIFTKSNVFPRHITKEFFDTCINNECFTALENWKTYIPIFPANFTSNDGYFCEINNSWYMKNFKSKYFNSYNDFLRFIYNDPVIPLYVHFATGGNYIVPRTHILKLPKVVYQNLRLFISHCMLPAEAHIIERAIHTLWMSNFELSQKILTPINANFIYRDDNKEKLSRKIYFIFCSIILKIFKKNNIYTDN